MMDITLLGTASLMPIPERALTSAFLTCGGHSILFDCGEGTQTAARKAGVSLMKTNIIALTHYHGDHIFGLPGLFQTMFSMGRTEPLYITGPEGLRSALEPIIRLTGFTSFEIRPFVLPREGIYLSKLLGGRQTEDRLIPFATEHRVPSRGYCFSLDRAGKFLPDRAQKLGVPVTQWKLLQKGQSVTLDGKTVKPEDVTGEKRKGIKFVFSGDTAYCGSLVSAAEGADLLICDATYAEEEQTELAHDHGHMTFREAALTAKQANVKRLWLSHYSQMIEDPEQYLDNAKPVFENAVCGEDGMKIQLRFEENGI
jgi:ribonuclease Z